MDTLRRDLQYATRGLAKSPGFTIVALATLAIGIGSSTAIFSMVDTVVFRPFPYKEPDRLVKVWSVHHRERFGDMSLPDFLDIQAQATAFEHVAADDWGNGGAQVTTNWLSTLGVTPALGRDFGPEEAEPGRDRVAILTDTGWRRRFGADPTVLGKTLDVGSETLTIVGVLPRNVLRYEEDLLRPLVPSKYSDKRDYRDLDVVARLKPGVTIEQAQAEVATIARRLEAVHPDTNKDRGARVGLLHKRYAGVSPGNRASRALVLAFASAGLLLLIACANVAGLMLARATARRRESLIRSALGASRARLLRQWMTESLLVFAGGGLLGMLLARWTLDGLVAFAVRGGYVPERVAVAIDGRAAAFGFLVALIAGVVFGLGPSLRASRVFELMDALRDSTPSRGARAKSRRVLLIAELALSVVLLVGFGLLVRSLQRLQAVPLGFDPAGVVLTGSDVSGHLGTDFPRQLSFWRESLARIRSLPDVETAAAVNRLPFAARQKRFAIEGRADVPKDRQPAAGDVFVSPDFFRVMRMPLVSGRAFADADGLASAPVVIVSESLARRYFSGEDPIGRRLRLDERKRARADCCSGSVGDIWREIVGVVGDVRQGSLDESSPVVVYRPYSQVVEHDMAVIVRAPSAAGAARLSASLDRNVPQGETWTPTTTLGEVLESSPSRRLLRFLIILLGAFAGVAVLLAAIGIYGLAAQAAAERTREIGIRMALGATRATVILRMLADAAVLAAGGLLVGLPGAWLLTRFASSLLFEVSPIDTPTYVTISLLLAMLIAVATYIPARRAAGIDPVRALRCE